MAANASGNQLQQKFTSKMSVDSVNDQLTPEEEKKCQQAFQVLVKDYDKPLHEQIIDAGELKSLIEMMGQKIADEEIFRMVSEADRKNDGKITYKVFRQIIIE